MNQNPTNKNLLIFKICATCVVALIIISLSPLVIPENTAEPFLFYLPRTLWSGIATYILIVALTYLATRYYNDENEKAKEKE